MPLLSTPATSGEWRGERRGERRPVGAVASLILALGDLTSRLPARPEPLFAGVRVVGAARRERAARRARIATEIGEPLARRYGVPALYSLAPAQPDAILPEERAQLTPLSATDHERALAHHGRKSNETLDKLAAACIIAPSPPAGTSV